MCAGMAWGAWACRAVTCACHANDTPQHSTGTPIINPPQSGVLGMHGIFERPVAINGEVVIRPMMYVALTYDHRLIDGREAVLFLRKVKEGIEDPIWMIMG